MCPSRNGLPLTIFINTVEVGLDVVREEGEVGADYLQAGAGQEYDEHTPLGLLGVVIAWRVCPSSLRLTTLISDVGFRYLCLFHTEHPGELLHCP